MRLSMLKILKQFIQETSGTTKCLCSRLTHYFIYRINALAFRLSVATPKRGLSLLHPVVSGIYGITHRYIVSRKQPTGPETMRFEIGIRPKRRLLYPAIAFLIGIQLTVYQLIVFAYPVFNGSDISTGKKSSRRELVNMRTANSKHFLNPDGTMTALLYATPIHYKNADGEWEDIDTDIGSDRKIESAPYKASFEENPAYRLTYKGISIRLALKTNDSAQAFNEDNTVSIDGVPPAITVESIDKQESSPTTNIFEDIKGKYFAAMIEETSSQQNPEEIAGRALPVGSTGDASQTASIGDVSKNTSLSGSTGNTEKQEQRPTSVNEPAMGVIEDPVTEDPVAEDPSPESSVHFKSDINENEMRYKDVFQDTDLLLSAEPYSIEKWLILKSDAAPDTFEFVLDTNKAPKLVDRHLEWGEVATLDCYAMDASGTMGKVDFSYSPNSTSSGVITLKVDKNFLSTASYPVKIDPTMTLNPSFDNYISAVDTDTVYRTEPSCLVGKTSTSLNRMLLWFNMSSLSGKSINSAIFSLFENGTGKAGKRFKLHRLTEPWNTTYTTWDSRDESVGWETAGGTYNGTRLGAVYVSALTDGAEATFDITTVAQQWALGTFQNYGLLFKSANELNNNNNCGFYMSEQGGNYRPKIEIDYIEMPDEPAGLIQYNADHSTVVPTGGASNDGVATNLYFDMTMDSPNATDMLTPEVEIRPVGTAFTGTATHSGSPVSYSGDPVTGSVSVTGLQAGGSYHWQAWVSNVSGDGEKISYGENSDPDDIDIMLGSSISLTIDSTYNRDGTPGSNSVNFGSVSPEESPFIIDNDPDRHAVQLTVISDSTWSLNVQASGNLFDEITGKSIGIGRLRWRNHGSSDSWIPFQTSPYTILSGQDPTLGTTLRYNYRLVIVWNTAPGNYGTTLTYTLASP